MITANDFKNGMVIDLDGKFYKILEFQHVKPGKGGAFVRAKVRDVKAGSVIDRTFRPRESFEQIYVEDRQFQYLYRDGDNFYFMNSQTYEQVSFTGNQIGDKGRFLKEGLNVKVFFYREKADRKKGPTPSEIELPTFVELKVTEAPPGIKGNTVSSPTKEIALETGYKLQVPLFVEEGDVIRVNTGTGKYVERKK